MYSTCLYCHAALGTNEVIEAFPVGRRLAFDSANGRFWVICPSCKRWNLSPLEERWDAMDECERLFERARLRMSTDNIGLARIAEGTELVRVGAALRPEMAAWRFGRTIGERRKRAALVTVGSVGMAAAIYGGAAMAGGALVLASMAGDALLFGGRGVYERIRGTPLPNPEGGAPVRVTLDQLRRVTFSVEDDEPLIRVKRTLFSLVWRGEQARRVLPQVIAGRNWKGAPRKRLEDAVTLLGRMDTVSADRPVADTLFRQLATWRKMWDSPPEYEPAYLALEMALNEQAERELLAGELLDLEFAWREAEELARIADTLVPTAIEQALVRLKARIGG